MSETLRTLNSTRYRAVGTRRRRRRKPYGCSAFLLLLLCLAAWALWVTRDAYPMAQLIPRKQGFRVVAADILGNRDRIAASVVWGALPPSWGLTDTPGRLTQDLGMPEWVLNNLIGPVCQVSGNDLQAFGDVLFVTRMQRIGCLVEKLHWLVPGIKGDRAGGLNLRWLKDAEVYYAVRGRVLLASPSRGALIAALTLSEEDSLDPDALARAIKTSGAQDLHGTMAFAQQAGPAPSVECPASPSDRLGDAFSSLSFAVRVEKQEACVKCRAVLRPAWQERFGGLLRGVSPQTLVLPPEGMVALAADFGKPVREVCEGLAALSEEPVSLETFWEGWTSAVGEEEGVGVLSARFVMGLIGPMGPGIRLSWRGIDLDEILPMPEVVGTFDAAPEQMAAVFVSLPPVPPDMPPWESFPRYDPEAKRASLPMFGGPSIEPTAAAHGNTLLVSTSRTVADALLGVPPRAKRVDGQGNLYVCVRPHRCAQAIHDAGALLAENDLLKGHNAETFEAAMVPWIERSALVSECASLLAYEDGEVTGEFHLICAETGSVPGE